jgi:hypothetical protein
LPPWRRTTSSSKRANASRSGGPWDDDDYDVLADGVVVGRIFHAGYAETREAAMAAFAKS